MHKYVIAATLAIVISSTAVALYWESLIKDLEWRYSDLDPKRIRKAYRSMMLNSLKGTYGDLDDADDRKMDSIFMLEYDRTA